MEEGKRAVIDGNNNYEISCYEMLLWDGWNHLHTQQTTMLGKNWLSNSLSLKCY